MDQATTVSTILVIDDEEIIRQSFCDQLEDLGFRVLTAENGQIGIGLVESEKPDLVLTDLRMPVLGGLDVIEHLKSTQPDLPIIVISGAGRLTDAVEALHMGAYDYLTKPVNDPSVIQHAINKALEHARLEIANRHYQQHLEDEVRERTGELRELQLKIIQRLGRAGEYRDNETGTHVIRMSKSCKLLALAAGLGEERAEKILYASPMHDVGKIGIPDTILLKPGPLDDEEMTIMKTHTLIGADIIGKNGSELLNLAHQVALYHHERWDGKGYPTGLKGEEIPIESRIASICDVFDAVTSSRPYKEAWSVDKATQLIKDGAGTQFDPTLASLFVEIIPQVSAIKDKLPDEKIDDQTLLV